MGWKGASAHPAAMSVGRGCPAVPLKHAADAAAIRPAAVTMRVVRWWGGVKRVRSACSVCGVWLGKGVASNFKRLKHHPRRPPQPFLQSPVYIALLRTSAM